MLRTRLFLNLVPFVVILLAVGVYAIVLFSRLASTVDSSVMQNYRSVVAAQSMSLALARMEAGLRLALDASQSTGPAVFEENARLFEQNLAVQSNNSELPGEDGLTRQLRSEYQPLRDAGNAILGHTLRREQQRALYEQHVVGQVQKMVLLLDQIRRLNDSEILAASQKIQQINQRVTNLMVIGMAVALNISAYAFVQLGRSILGPIQLLTRATREVGAGNLEQTVPVLSQDELGELANAFNKMAAQLKAYRQSTTEKIVRLHRTMESTLASFPDPIFVLDREGRIELKNPAAEELGQRLELNGTLPARLQEAAGNVLRSGKDFLPHSFKEVHAYRRNGVEKSFLPRILIMRGEQHESIGVAVVLYDVTRFRLLDDAKTNLVATVSHELKTPLTSVRMVLHLLLEQTIGSLTPKQSELLETAREDSERLLRILNDLLDLARLEAGDPGLHLENVSPAELVRSVAEEFERVAAQQDLRLITSAEESLPAVRVDRQRIAHVFRNFVTNAIKHSSPGDEIQLRASQTDVGDVEFSVSDHGPGIPEQHQGRIFDRFFRVPGQQKTGAGLGLSIAREIAVAHGGRIGVRSQRGKGSSFYLVLTRADKETHSPAAS